MGTLGVAQVMSLLFRKYVKQQPFTMFVKINVASQFMNWFITFLYFLTPVSSMMIAQLQIRTLGDNIKEDLQARLTEYMDLKDKYCKRSLSSAQLVYFEDFPAMLNKEILITANIKSTPQIESLM